MKRLTRELSLRRRYSRLTVSDLVNCEKLEKVLLLLAFKIGRAQYLSLRYHEKPILRGPRRIDRTIDSFCDSDCYLFFRFTKPTLIILLILLNFNNEEGETKYFYFDNFESMSGMEIFLRGLYEQARRERALYRPFFEGGRLPPEKVTVNFLMEVRDTAHLAC